MMDLDLRRRFFAEEIEAVCKLRSSALVDAFATVARERFLRPGPWAVPAESDFLADSGMQTRVTPDADPTRAYHNIVVVNRAQAREAPALTVDGILAGWERHVATNYESCATSSAARWVAQFLPTSGVIVRSAENWNSTRIGAAAREWNDVVDDG